MDWIQWIEFNYFNPAVPVQGDSLLLTTISPGFPGNYLIDLIMKAPSGFEPGTSWLPIDKNKYEDTRILMKHLTTTYHSWVPPWNVMGYWTPNINNPNLRIIQSLRIAWKGRVVVDFVVKRYGNYGEGEHSQVIRLSNAGKKPHLTHFSVSVTFCTLRTHLCRK